MNWKAEVISFCVCVHVGTWHAHIYIQANELLGSFTLTGTRKKKLSLRIELEKSSEAWWSKGRSRKGNRRNGNDK